MEVLLNRPNATYPVSSLTMHSPSNSSSFRSPLINFNERVVAIAGHDLYRSRSALVERTASCTGENRSDKPTSPWDIRPIDISVKLYSKGVEMSKRTRSSRTLSSSASKHEKAAVPRLDLPELLKTKEVQTNDFQTKFRPISPFKAKVESVRASMLPKDTYKSPTKHCFRGNEDWTFYGPGQQCIEDFTTFKERDPMNLNFRKEMLRKTLPELSTTDVVSVRDCISEPIPKLIQGPKWRKELYLPRAVYKRGRSPKSALYQRIQDRLSQPTGLRHPNSFAMRPDIYDNKTEDFLHITESKSSSTSTEIM